MATAGEVASLDSGPLEKGHIRDMVQRNAIQDMAYGRYTKWLESQKKAFVRQNTRDEDEMKTLLCRLQTEQQMPTLEDEAFCDNDTDDEEISDTEEAKDDTSMYDVKAEETANPYPITIVPKYSGNLPKRTNSKKAINIPGKHNDVDDVQESISTMSMSPPAVSYNSSQSNTVSNSSRDESLGDWLASPDAISSVRRARKSLSEQASRKSIIRINSEYISQQDLANINILSQCTRGNMRSNSLKDRRKSSMSKESLVGCRRGSSLKEKKTVSESISDTRKKSISRSVSMLTRTTLAEFNMRQDTKARKQVLDHGIASVSDNTTRHWSGKEHKQALSRKSSDNTESDGMKCNKRPGSFKTVI